MKFRYDEDKNQVIVQNNAGDVLFTSYMSPTKAEFQVPYKYKCLLEDSGLVELTEQKGTARVSAKLLGSIEETMEQKPEPTKSRYKDNYERRQYFKQRKYKLLRIDDLKENMNASIINNNEDPFEQDRRLEMLLKTNEMYRSYGIGRHKEMEEFIEENKRFLEPVPITNRSYLHVMSIGFEMDKIDYDMRYVSDDIISVASRFKDSSDKVMNLSEDKVQANLFESAGMKCLKRLEFPNLVESVDQLSLEDAISFMTDLVEVRYKSVKFLGELPQLNFYRSVDYYYESDQIVFESANVCNKHGMTLEYKRNQSEKDYQGLSPREAIWKGILNLL